jgi:hypothetical protein
MSALSDFLSRKRGQERRQRLNELLNYYIPPNLRPAANFAGGLTPSASYEGAVQGFEQALTPGATAADIVGGVGQGLSGTMGIAAPLAVANKAGMPAAQAAQEAFVGFSTGADYAGNVIKDRLNQPGQMPTVYSNPILGVGDGASDRYNRLKKGGREALREFFGVASERMDKKPVKRIQPDPDRVPFLDRDYKTPSGVAFEEDLGRSYPRNPNPFAPLPKGDRARVLVERRSEIADRLAEKIAESGVMDTDAKYFYNSDGPLFRGAQNAGLTPKEAADYLNDFSKIFAATSPRTPVEPNIKNTTAVMAKLEAGIPHREIVGGGTVDPKTGKPGISEKGYPMMTGKGGIHGNLIDDVVERGAIDRATNTKPATFGANMVGNLSGATVDTHAIRGALIALNDIDPGAVPEGFILPKFRDAYKENPNKLTPDMIDDTIGTQMIEIDGRKVKAQTEYPVFADIYHELGEKIGNEKPATAQAAGWFGLGEETNLVSDRATVSEIFDQRIDVTAKELGLTREQVAELVFRRKIPLMSLLGGTVATGGLLGNSEDKGRNNGI